MSVFYDSDEFEDFDSQTNSEIKENEEDLPWDSDWEDDEEFYSQVDHDSHVSNMMKHGTQKLTYPFRGFTKEPAAAPATAPSSSITPTTFLAPFDPALPSTSGTSYQRTNKVQPLSAVNMAPIVPALPSTSGTPSQYNNKVQLLPAVYRDRISRENRITRMKAAAAMRKLTPERSSKETSKKVFSSGLEQIQPTKPTLPFKFAAPQSFTGSGQTQKRQYHSIAETQQECNDIVQVEKKPRVEELQNNATCEITESANDIGGNDEGPIVIVLEDLTADEEDQKSEDGGNEGDSIGAEDSATENVVNSDETREEKNGSPQIAAAVTENPGTLTEKALGNTAENSGKTEASDAETKLSQDLNSSEATAKTLQKRKAAGEERKAAGEEKKRRRTKKIESNVPLRRSERLAQKETVKYTN